MSLSTIATEQLKTYIIGKKIPFNSIYKLDQLSKYLFLESLKENDFKRWKNRMIHSLVEIESSQWVDASTELAKYYDMYGGRDYYEDIEIIFKDRNDDDDAIYFDEEDDLTEPYLYGIKNIRQYDNPYYDVYLDKVYIMFDI